MLDFHAASSGGNKTTLAAVSTILAGNDGQTVAGVPLDKSATLVGWGGATTIADTIAGIQLLSQDQQDPANGYTYSPGATSVAGMFHFWENLPFKTGKRQISMAQNTAAANNMVYWMDWYMTGAKVPSIALNRYGKPGKNAAYTVTFGGALTAITWASQAFAPAPLLPAGKYAILGARADALTNYGFVRFQHADFGPWLPGFPIIDTALAAARATVGDSLLTLEPGYQFVDLSDILKQPCCPVFTVSAQGTGLNVQAAAITADTPLITILLAAVD